MELPATALSLPTRLQFPVTVQRIHAQRGSAVRKTQTLLTYSFLPAKPDQDGNRERQVRAWESPVEGEVVSWAVREGQVLHNASQAIVQIREPCTHDVQLQGLCALCGKDLTATDYTGFSDTSRATISMVHDVGGLTVSRDEAHRLETATTSRLLKAKKLSLIVDLDQTIVHATVEPTVGEWLQDPKNPNYKALEGVQKFKLTDESPARKVKVKKQKPKPPPAAAEGAEDADDESSSEEEEEEGCWYYIKMRPGLRDFLKRIAEIYEMHVYTMGTRAYASEVCKVIDPDGGLFGGRILSRDESGSMTRKSLQRLFPCDTNMVVIIDDRADIWDGSPHLVKVVPYDFFGIGDINGAFLPKKKELVPPPPSPPVPSTSAAPSPASSSPASDAPSTSDAPRTRDTTTPDSTPPADSPLSAPHLPDSVLAEPTTVSDLLVEPSPSALAAPALAEATTAAADAIHDVIEARPLEKAAREAHDAHERSSHAGSASPSPEVDGEKNDEAAEGAAGAEEEVEEEAVLKDDDTELDRVWEILSSVRNRFFELHEAEGAADVADIIPSMKRQTLRDTHLVFSGLVALGSRPEDSEYWKLAQTFGARCSADLSSSVTHLVANQEGTAKVHSARRNPRIRVVYPQWLLDSVAQWRRLPEEAYLLPVPERASTPGSPIRPELSGGEDEKGAEDAADDEALEGDLHLEDLDWGDAMKEVDDLLLETDDEDSASLFGGGGNGDTNGADTTDGESDASATPAGGTASAPRRKRPRVSLAPDAGAALDAKETESPLQKRVKTARSRKSGLKQSLSAAALERSAAARLDGPDEASAAATPAESKTPLPSSGASQASSSIDSDDEDLLASMAADLEQGWS
ncbi:hypothetical protein Rhopal_002573-T1 [Rhodotorula paludigena]|uniref:RNA polymerase II subunit A C-terminal domain phosphatase n=1 Tax=Rhodotorula paludigena TaxID=86838 RepID=A0AAV5GAY4_9BASI|nr:hypothetical protein Rhopal_002573-T1 [Rhodotorula paludigena]